MKGNKHLFQVYMEQDQVELLQKIGKALGLKPNRHGVYNRNEIVHLALKALCQQYGLEWGDKPQLGGARGGANAQAEQKAIAKKALKKAKPLG